MRLLVGLVLVSLMVTGCSGGGDEMSKADQDRLKTALNTHEDASKHGGPPPPPNHSKAAAQDFLSQRMERIKAIKAGQVPGWHPVRRPQAYLREVPRLAAAETLRVLDLTRSESSESEIA